MYNNTYERPRTQIEKCEHLARMKFENPIEKAQRERDERVYRFSSIDEAIGVLDLFLDNAVMGKLNEVRIIHGKGTGALRKAVHASLRRNKAVKGFRLGNYGEGESGVTVVELK